jgi:ribosome-associated protein
MRKAASSLSSQDNILLLARAADEARALDIVVLEVGNLLPICDYFLICHSRSAVHAQAICDKIAEVAHQAGLRLHHREGSGQGEWVILDYLGVVVHVFSEEARKFYGLERLWADAPRLDLSALLAPADLAPSGGEQ